MRISTCSDSGTASPGRNISLQSTAMAARTTSRCIGLDEPGAAEIDEVDPFA
jgi:hypothetical protein